MSIDLRSMLFLIRKDLRLHWVAFIILVVFQLATFVTFEAQFPPVMQPMGAVFLQGIASIGTFVMAYRVTAAEEANNSIRFLKSLPLTTIEIFGAKYLYMTMYVVVNLVVLNLFLSLFGNLMPGEKIDAPTVETLGIGFVIQFAFGVLLVSVASLFNSEKAIWVPFPLVVLLLNGYAQLTSNNGPIATLRLWAYINENWLWMSAGVVAELLILVWLGLRALTIKRSLI
ncbi:MAG: hypothetical protein B5766_02890 [Candidatus Lumbricidophila eiseniae]|uniref:ABC transporter permease n=1 Tax=Candidatus Lumbricidiphila eiseniae TaxID=1969409 RepID=A0A2A6FTX0_9MICO|nr:MAG: hypothetical protein B5766_02890 [Candidatus Lumbricidophila eiseniae]